ncbi:hypothetical protein [Streptomyces fagopyri]
MDGHQPSHPGQFAHGRRTPRASAGDPAKTMSTYEYLEKPQVNEGLLLLALNATTMFDTPIALCELLLGLDPER